jgi:Na+/proline symporter
MEIDPSLRVYSWVFLAVYLSLMVAFGVAGRRRVKNADDFATARGGYGPLFLALAFAATTASGATFLGLPGIGYKAGLSTLWLMYGYPIGVYVGVLICLRVVSRAGQNFGSRSIPEYLGDRYQSDGIRVAVSLFSLLLLFYLAGQLVAGLVMFQQMLGLGNLSALLITASILLLYVGLGGAHADILTDGVQGGMMLAIALLIGVLVLLGFGVEGGLGGLIDRIHDLDPAMTAPLHDSYPLLNSRWDIFALLAAHVPLGLLPHIGNKLWALDSSRNRRRFVVLAFAFGLLIPTIGAGGILARGVLGDALQGGSANQALPMLFIEIFPPWLAALLGMGILAAVMSTADGLVVSTSQIFANDLYRRTFAPRWHGQLSEAEIDRRVLRISRWGTAAGMFGAVSLAWLLIDINIAILVWIGVGGMMAAFAGPLLLGVLWKGVTKAGAYAGFASGAAVFLLTHPPAYIPAIADLYSALAANTALAGPVDWLLAEASNPYSCAAMGEIISLLATWGVSRLTRNLPADHIREVFGA